ncbi:hypothetical protein K474DRAFT_1676591 [Panus rudis PR-1116 ss-1]|nr:hypothetical protein K474DRAFT_1676591 [Panus rudis PR-1116 ss-1]
MNGTTPASPLAGLSSPPHFSDTDEDNASHDDHPGDYSTRFDAIMGDDEGEDAGNTKALGHSDDEEEGFFYTGVDAADSGGYKEQLRDVLGPDHTEDEQEEVEVERSLVHDVEENEKFAASIEDEARHTGVLEDISRSASPQSQSASSSVPRITVFASPMPPLQRPFLHPTISRLRSHTPHASRSPSVASVGTLNSVKEGLSAAPSHFSALSLSRETSTSNVHDQPNEPQPQQAEEREVFRWTRLRNIEEIVYGKQPSKASAILGTPAVGSPTVLAANGLVCIGTDTGKVIVFDFRQNLKCICGDDPRVGAVTALALSFDHTFIAVGHSTGHINLFDLSKPKTPARSVPPTSLAAVEAGTQEGHLVNSRIVSIGFVAGRHTAIVSADETGLAFYHSLGRVLFVDASDILRILGKYPDEESPSLALGQVMFRRRKTRKATNTILAMGPLPLGTAAHPTDAYQLIALLTPVKLVIVGLRPTPKTWYRKHRETDEEPGARARFRGCLAWFPSVSPTSTSNSENEKARDGKQSKQNGVSADSGTGTTAPMLAYSWGHTINLIWVSESKILQKTTNARTGKVVEVEVGRITFEEVGKWTTKTKANVLAIQWLNVNQVVVLTTDTLDMYDVRSFKLVEHVPFQSWTLVSPILSHTTNGSVSYSDAVSDVAHSFRVYKGKIFILGQHEIKVGTLLTWADRILSLVESGDFLTAISLTRSYYTNEAPGNRNGLPSSPSSYKSVVGEKLHELMVASARYAFSEDRFRDETHITPDNRGVDRTELFQGLVVTCAEACIVLGDFEFLFEELYGYYEEYGIGRMFLNQLEPFVLDGRIRHVPPRITQKLVEMHAQDDRPDLVERVIWHIDPECLDVEQAITLCQRYKLYDALVYVYTRALRDYMLPVVEFVGLIRKLNRYRRALGESTSTSTSTSTSMGVGDADSVEGDLVNAYKIFPYLGNVLTGLSYPSEEPLPEDEALRAKDDVYEFIFSGRSSVWPKGPGGKLILTSDEENGDEPTYPYTRLLLRFDAESFLHTLDLAFEDSSYFDDDVPHSMNRLVIIKILYEILLSTPTPSLPISTFIHIFIARNVAIYPLSIQMSPSELQSILIGLAQCPDESTREDRQLAAEYLLSAYTPHDGESILRVFERAGFYRILRSWYRQERRWVELVEMFVKDPEVQPAELFPSVEEVVQVASRSNKGEVPRDVFLAIQDSLPALLETSAPRTAVLLDRRIPGLHDRAMEVLQERPSRDRFLYLRTLLGSPQKLEEEFGDIPRKGGPSSHLPPHLLRTYTSLLCEHDPKSVVHELRYIPPDSLDWSYVVKTCEDYGVYDAAIWSLDYRDEPQRALAKTEEYIRKISSGLAQYFSGSSEREDVDRVVESLQMIGSAAVDVCLERSQYTSPSRDQAEDLWFTLLKSQINSLHHVSIACQKTQSEAHSEEKVQKENQVLESLRSLVQTTFNSLLSINSAKAVSFPRLFKRLVDSATTGPTTQHAIYNEFRVILTGMLEAYRSDGDMLFITKHMVDCDVFVAVEKLAIERSKGWKPSSYSTRGNVCHSCRKRLYEDKDQKKKHDGNKADEEGAGEAAKVVVSRTGRIYHDRCLPPDFDSAGFIDVHTKTMFTKKVSVKTPTLAEACVLDLAIFGEYMGGKLCGRSQRIWLFLVNIWEENFAGEANESVK